VGSIVFCTDSHVKYALPFVVPQAVELEELKQRETGFAEKRAARNKIRAVLENRHGIRNRF
jgi:hypothetical protein